MYEAFREHGNAAFCPDTSTVMLSEQGLLKAESSRPACSSSPTGMQQASSAGICHSLSTPLTPGLDSQTADQSTGTDVARHDECTDAEAANEWVGLGSTAGSRGHDRWPHDIEWRLDNPLVRPCFVAGACNTAHIGPSAGVCAHDRWPWSIQCIAESLLVCPACLLMHADVHRDKQRSRELLALQLCRLIISTLHLIHSRSCTSCAIDADLCC